MALFKFSNSNEPKSSVLRKTALDAMSVFNSTITKLRSVIKEATSAKEANSKTIEDLTAENNKLTEVIEENTLIAQKLSDLINPNSTAPSSSGNE